MKKTIFIFIFLFTLQGFTQEDFVIKSNCAESDYVLGDIESSINFTGSNYTPKCLKIMIGSQVTIAASKKHPLSPQNGVQGNPIVVTESTKAFVFNKAGTFGYYCDKHGNASGQGMAGAIWVVEEL